MTSSIDLSPRAQFEEDGFYLATEPIFPEELIQNAVNGMEAIRRGEYDTGRPPQPSPWNPGDDPNTLCKIEQPQFASRAIQELLTYSTLGKLAAEITGATMIQAWWVQLLVKPPSLPGVTASTNVGWHQDRTYWGQWEPGSELFTAWIALSDVRAESGSMRFVRGSHAWEGRLSGDFFAQDLEGLRADLQVPEGRKWEETAAVLPPGGVSFHHNLALHGSGPNLDTTPRRSFAVHLRTQNSRPLNGQLQGLTQFIEDTDLCPVLYGNL